VTLTVFSAPNPSTAALMRSVINPSYSANVWRRV
jgi:hypothetical protein